LRRSRLASIIVVLAVGGILAGSYFELAGRPTRGPSVASRGLSFSPRTTSGSDITDFFTKAKEGGGIVSWAGDWNELGDASSAPYVVATLAPNYSLTPIIEAQVFSQSTGSLLRPLDNVTTKSYLQEAVKFASQFKPKYIALGIEVNILYERSPSDFDSFVSLYSRAYAAVKGASPDTKVFTVFQLERMKGLDGGLFGGTNDPSKAEWSLLDRFNVDLVAFTSYPDLIFHGPSSIPQDYYSEISQHTAKPVAFTELGWHTGSSIPGWESNASAQAQFVKGFFNMTTGLHPEFAIWSFLYDPVAQPPFDTMGFFPRSGTAARPAWNEWVGAG
jgi:hypothetical protein